MSTLQVILDVDWDVVLAIVLGLAAIGYAVLEYRRTSKLDDLAQSLGERLAKVETVVSADAPHSLAERVSELEARIEYAERIATLEARVDYQAPKITKRRSDGKFGSDKPPTEVP